MLDAVPFVGRKFEEQLPGPAFFIVVPIYMMAEKATDVLLEDIGEKRKV